MEQALGCVDISTPGQIVGGPEAANAECAFPAHETVIAVLVSVEQTVSSQTLHDAVECTDHAWIRGLAVSETWYQQQACVDLCTAKLADIAADRGVKADVLDQPPH